jgi:Flp pilus assembly protein TadG
MVTAELAVALPTVVVVLVLAMTALFAVTTELRCTDAAATAARLLARGESPATARSAVQAIAGAGASLDLSTAAGSVRVDVRAPAGLPLVHTLLPLPPVSAAFSQPLEPGVAGP